MIKQITNSLLSLGTSSTARNLYWVFSGNAISIVLTFFTTILIANQLTREENGIFLALFTLANLLSELGEAGIGGALSRFVPQALVSNKPQEARRFLGAAFRLELVIATAILGGLLIFAPVLARTIFANTPARHVMIVGMMTFLLIFYVFWTFALSAYKRFREVALVNIFYSLVRLAMLTLLMVAASLTLTSTLFVYTAAALLAVLYGLIFLKPAFITATVNAGDIRKLLGFSSYLALQKVFIAVSSRLDLLMLVPLAGALEAGVYGIASRFAMVYPLAISSFGQVLAPKFGEFKTAKAGLGFFKKASLVVAALLFSQLLFYLFAPLIMSILVPKYSDAIPVFQALLVAMTGFIIATPFTSFLIYTLKKPQVTTVTSILQLLIIVIANSYFIPRMGRFGPVVGIGLGNLVVLIVSVAATVYFIRRES